MDRPDFFEMKINFPENKLKGEEHSPPTFEPTVLTRKLIINP